MKLTIQDTGGYAGHQSVPGRLFQVWDGHTEDGTPIAVMVMGIGLKKEATAEQIAAFEAWCATEDKRMAELQGMISGGVKGHG